jgi:hypothetical protein
MTVGSHDGRENSMSLVQGISLGPAKEQQDLPVYFKAGHGLSRSTGGTFCQLAVTAPMIPPPTIPVPTAVRVRETQSSGLSAGSLSDCTETGTLAPPSPLIVEVALLRAFLLVARQVLLQCCTAIEDVCDKVQCTNILHEILKDWPIADYGVHPQLTAEKDKKGAP